MNITVEELKKKLTDGVIIDLRSIQKYNNRHIPFAKNIPYSKLAVDYVNLLDKNTTYYLYCEKGLMSPKICNYLNRFGYKTINIEGGYEEWIMHED